MQLSPERNVHENSGEPRAGAIAHLHSECTRRDAFNGLLLMDIFKVHCVFNIQKSRLPISRTAATRDCRESNPIECQSAIKRLPLRHFPSPTAAHCRHSFRFEKIRFLSNGDSASAGISFSLGGRGAIPATSFASLFAADESIRPSNDHL